jgi:hypothetical protein
LLAEPVGLVFAVREVRDQLRHLPQLAVEGLSDREASMLLTSAGGVVLDERIRDRIVAETHGNPLALLELPLTLNAGAFEGFGAGGVSAVANGVEESFRRRILALPAETQTLLLIAAAEPLGDSILVWRAAAVQGVSPEAADAAVAEGLCEFDTRIRFRHPLVRSAAYRAGSLEARWAAHASIAEVTDGEADPDRRAWHLALASAGPDDAVADELDRSAARARARAGQAAAASPPRARARAAERSSSSATASSGPAEARARCHARRSGSASPSVTAAIDAWACRRSSRDPAR